MERNFRTEKTFRYEVIDKSLNKKIVLYVLHGYGQLARFFIRKFKVLSDDFIIVAPEGMHRFYLKGSSGRVGASWMTKEARETDISDNIHYLNKLNEEIMKEYDPSEIHLLGFSQGGATAARWEQLGNVQFTSLTLWACVFPPDLDMPAETNKAIAEHKYFTIGDQDQFYSKDEQQKLLSFYKELNYKCIHYQGDHDIVSEPLLNIYANFINKER